MNAEQILDALGDVKDAYIADAGMPVRRPRHAIRRLGILAAVLVLALALTIIPLDLLRKFLTKKFFCKE